MWCDNDFYIFTWEEHTNCDNDFYIFTWEEHTNCDITINCGQIQHLYFWGCFVFLVPLAWILTSTDFYCKSPPNWNRTVPPSYSKAWLFHLILFLFSHLNFHICICAYTFCIGHYHCWHKITLSTLNVTIRPSHFKAWSFHIFHNS